MSIREIIVEKLHKEDLHYREIKIEDVNFGIEYLTHYGYIHQLPDNVQGLINFENAVRLFQKFFQLEEDGLFGPKTLRAMYMPRCNMKDVVDVETASNYGWSFKNLTYFIEAFIDDLPKTEVETIIDLAFKAWEDVCDININRTNTRSSANFIVGVGSGRADDFDGPNGTLAWNELATKNSRQVRGKFDNAETWLGRGSTGRGIYLFNVAAHEFGHGLGLTHSSANGALMAPYYNANVALPQQRDDITRIQALYGKRITPQPNPDPQPNPNPTTQKLILEIDGQFGKVHKVQIPGVRVQIIS